MYHWEVRVPLGSAPLENVPLRSKCTIGKWDVKSPLYGSDEEGKPISF